MANFATDAINKLCSKEQLALLDSIDRLRLQGINNYVSLPQIIVCGDQSSGKSSVLEAISGVSFPIKSNLCTRFPTEVVLRRAPHLSASVSIIPHESRPESEQKALRGFHGQLSGFGGLPQLVENAKFAMGITPHGKAFAKDILRVEITGPDRPHLTIVDLPGLIHSGTKDQPSSDVQLIKDVVQSYMREPRCIILAVVSAKNDFANQVVLNLARDADKSGTRTLGVITKPDTLTPGSESEAMFVSLAQNQQVEFRHGWHVLKNMDSEKGSWALSERDAEEARFFSSGAWAQLPSSCLGIQRLRSRLSKVLLAQIAAELPSLMREMETKFEACRREMETMGEPRATSVQQRRYLLHSAQEFQSLVKASAAGNYHGSFFGDAKTEPGYQKRIRAVIQNLNEDFAAEISTRGHLWEIGDSDELTGAVPVPVSLDPVRNQGNKIRRDDFIRRIKYLMRRTRGRELPGTYNPMLVADLFLEQSRPWEAIARRHVKAVWEAASNFVSLVADHIADDSTTKALRREVLEPAMRSILNDMSEKTTELLSPHREGHPITYSSDFTEALERVRRQRRYATEIERVLRNIFGVNSVEGVAHLNGRYALRDLADTLVNIPPNESNMEELAANEVLDCLDAYYTVRSSLGCRPLTSQLPLLLQSGHHTY